MATCTQCDAEFGSDEALGMHTRAKHPQEVKKPLLSSQATRKLRNLGIGLVVLAVIIGTPLYLISSVEVLPPTDFSGHVEVVPESHTSRKPFGDAVQKHMLEHVDGEQGGRPGVIINYNCDDYTCEPDLIDRLEAFADQYDFVYVAPYLNMDAKIAITTLGRIKTFDAYNQEQIDQFITGA